MPAGRTYTPIATTLLTSDTSTITFSSFPSTYTDLIIVLFGRSTRSSTDDTLRMRFNGDTGNNYSRTRILGDGSSATSARDSNQPGLNFDIMSAASNSSSTYSPNIYHIQNYSNATTFKTVVNRSNNANAFVAAAVGLWRSTSAITTIEIAPLNGSFGSGSRATLYGIEAA